MKVLLVNPRSQFLLNEKALPPLGLMYVSSAFKEAGHCADILDLGGNELWIRTLEERLPEGYDVLGVTCTTPQLPHVLEILRVAQRFDITTICGGPHATLKPEDLREFDIVCIGDGEATVPKIVAGERSFVKGFCGNIDLYHPDRESIDLWDYEFYVSGQRATSMVTSRSCAWRRCAFCSRYPMPYDKLRFHSVDYVKEEIESIVRLNFDAIALYDDEFFTHPKRDERIIKTLGKNNVVWRCFGKSDHILRNIKLVEHASRNGLREILLGVESGSDTILKTINKGVSIEENERAIRFLHGLKVGVKSSMMIGLPGESEETLKETEEFCERISPFVDTWDFCLFAPYPGSHVYHHPEKYDIRFDKQDTYRAYKGMHAEGWEPPHISTSKLSFERIMEFREHLEERFKYGGREG